MKKSLSNLSRYRLLILSLCVVITALAALAYLYESITPVFIYGGIFKKGKATSILKKIFSQKKEQQIEPPNGTKDSSSFTTDNVEDISLLGSLDMLGNKDSSQKKGNICNLEHWVHGEFQEDKFVPIGYTDTASLSPPRDLKVTNQTYHWFSKDDAQACVSNKNVWVIGDSYMRNLFIGFMDVLRGNQAKPFETITKGVPEKAVKIAFLPKAFGDVGRAHIKENNSTATFIGGRRFGIGLYIDALKELFSNIKDDDLIILNVLIHDNKRNRVQSREFRGDMKKAELFYLSKIEELVKWLKNGNPKGKIVWSTSTSYKEEKVPAQFRQYQRNKRILEINRKARDIWLEAGFPTLDVFHITFACQAKTCTEDGSHHNRMVNRAKAHVLLNFFCNPPSCTGS